MAILTLQSVRVNGRAIDKADAIRQSGELLVQAGYVEPAYVGGMLAREQILSNYLGNGIAIPHGRREDLDQVRQTGISVLQLPQGVAWEAGEKAYLVIGLAVSPNHSPNFLTNLLEVHRDPNTIQLLIHTTDPSVIVDRLTRGLTE